MTFYLCISFFIVKPYLNKMMVVLLWCGQVCPYIIRLTVSLTASRYQHEVLDTEVIQLLKKTQRNAVVARWCSSPYLNVNNANVSSNVVSKMHSNEAILFFL